MINILNILKQLFFQLMNLFVKKYSEKQEIESDNQSDDESENINEPVLNKTAIRNAINFLKKHSQAYYAGKQLWPSGVIRGKRYNNILFTDTPELAKVYRFYTRGHHRLIDIDELTRKDYDVIHKKNWTTYCNLALSVFYNFFVDNPEKTLQRIGKTEYDANDVILNVRSGIYNYEGCGFIKTDKDDAGDIASLGGFVICCLFVKNGIGHVAAMTGHNEIFHAGKTFGQMSIGDGFGINNLNKIEYYYWGKL